MKKLVIVAAVVSAVLAANAGESAQTDPKEELRAADRQITGWVHIDVLSAISSSTSQPVADPNLSFLIHFNAEKNVFARVGYIEANSVEFFDGGSKVGMIYVPSKGTIHCVAYTSEQNKLIEAYKQELSTERLAATSYGGTFSKRNEAGFVWYDIQGRSTFQAIALDPNSKQIRRITIVRPHAVSDWKISYGAPNIGDIFSLGVPENTSVVKETDSNCTNQSGK